MSESLYRRNPKEGDIINVLKARRQLYNRDYIQTKDGKSASVRNPAWVTLTGYDKSCGGGESKQLPIKTEKIDATYYSGGSIKPAPDIESVVVEYSGEHGMARKVTGRIRCYKISDFEEIQRYFLLPGNEIDVSFGYENPSWGYGNGKTLKGFTVATFSFNTTQDGHWLCEFTAVSAAEAVKTLDMQLVVCNGCNDGTGQSADKGPLKYIIFEFGGGQSQNPVKGIAQLIASDSEKNGTTSIDDLQDGEVITEFIDYRPGSQDKSAGIVVYRGDHIRDWQAKIGAWIGSISKYLGLTKTEIESTNNQVYVTVGYIINRMINDQLLKAKGCGIAHERNKFNEMKIEFHPIYSKCKIADGITSGDPLTVLLLGNGNYKNDSGQGKNFDSDCKNLGAVKSYSSGDIKIQNILVHRDVVISAFNDATKQREANADSTDNLNSSKSEVVNVIDFFDKVSDHISSASGGSISLKIVENPDDLKSLIVVCENYGVSDKLQCVVFDPVDGDGSTRTCDVQSNVGSQEYRAAMFVGSSKKGDSVAAIRDCTDKLKETRESEYSKAKTDKDAIIKNPGNLGKNSFDPQEINGLKAVMTRLHNNNPKTGTDEKVHYPGMSISLEIDGTWGFTPGNAISTTQVPRKWRTSLNSYFMISRVTHSFQQSDWSCKIDGILGYYPNIEYIQL